MEIENEMKVKLNLLGWRIYQDKNGFASSNIDSEGYSYFSLDYFKTLFYPLSSDLFSDEVINLRTGHVVYKRIDNL